jgi:glycine cleavage system H lipoate-binding protein/ABC-type phosphate transport system substrate-binding protein
MKRAGYLFISLLLMTGSSLYSSNSYGEKKAEQGGAFTVLATPDLYTLTAKWADEYSKLNPGTNINVVNVESQEKAGDLIREGGIGFVSDDFLAGLKNESLWKEVVGRDVIVPVINAKNPFMDEINIHGISPDILASFVKNGEHSSWGDLLKNGDKQKVDFYCINDDGAIRNLSEFLKTDATRIAGVNPGNSAEVVTAIQNDPYAIGFCRLISLVDFKSQGITENVKLLPIDRNGNGLIDSNEKIYDDINNFSRGVWIGKYPKTLFSNIFTIAGRQPQNYGEVAFVKWVLTDGQKYLSLNGFSDLLVCERQSASDRLYNTRISAGASAGEKNLLKSLMFVIATVILAGLIANAIARQRKSKKAAVRIADSASHSILDLNGLNIPKGIYFDKTHTWAFLEANGNVRVGIDDFLQHITGKITRIKMKSPGKKVQKGEQILSIIQNGKQLNLYAPVSGTIIEQNSALEINSSSLNNSPYNDGWIYKIEPSNWIRESQLLFMADRQREFIVKEFARLKDFLMNAFGTATGQYAQVLLQDGGEISDGVLTELGPEIWEDFQTNFIDPSRQVWFYDLF